MRKNNGFTLIEIIVIIGVIAVLAGVSMSSYHTYAQETLLTNEVVRFVESMQLTKNRAYASEETTCANTFDGFAFYVKPNDNMYVVHRCCDGDCPSVQPPVEEHILPSPLAIIPDTTEIIFPPLAQPISFPLVPNNTQVNIIMQHIHLNRCYEIRVTKIGVIDYERVDCP